MGVKKEKYPLVCVLSNGDAPLMAFFEEDKAKEAAVKEGIDYLDVIRVGCPKRKSAVVKTLKIQDGVWSEI
jgi:hypothetical protein